MTFEKELEKLINRYSLENESNTPDFILAAYMKDSLSAAVKLINSRQNWYGTDLKGVEEECKTPIEIRISG